MSHLTAWRTYFSNKKPVLYENVFSNLFSRGVDFLCVITYSLSMESRPREIIYYEDRKGTYPAFEWLEKLKDKKTRVIIKGRIRRLEDGNLGLTRSIGQGLIELKIDYGPGYRVYLGFDGDTIIVVLATGDKSTQSKDIESARTRWRDYKERKK